jgi:hypothetical protein
MIWGTEAGERIIEAELGADSAKVEVAVKALYLVHQRNNVVMEASTRR